MRNIIRTEWLKIRKYPAFWWIIALTALAYPGINFIFYEVYKDLMSKENVAGQLAKIYIGNPFTFPEAWHTISFFSSLFVFIPSIVVIMLITNEYTYKTHRQNVIDGWSRFTFMKAKLADVMIISFVVTLLFAVVALILGLTNTNVNAKPGDAWQQIHYIGLFFLQTFAQLSVAFLVGFLVKKAFIALGIFAIYFFPFEPIVVTFLRERVKFDAWFMPLEVSDRLIPVPAFFGRIDLDRYNKALAAINQHIFFTILLLFIVWFICFKVHSRRDL